MRYQNNPANIRYSESNKWYGQISPKNGFCQFSDISYGIRALCIVLRTYLNKYNLHDVAQIISTFAPDFENDTPAYIRYIRGYLAGRGFDGKDIKFGTQEFYCLCTGIMWYETNFPCSRLRVENVVNMFNLKG